MTAAGSPRTAQTEGRIYVAHAMRTGPAITGYIYDQRDPSAHLIVELMIDGVPVALARAEIYRAALEQAGIGDGCYGFSFVLAADVLSGGGSAQVTLANHAFVIAPPIALGSPEALRQQSGGEAGRVEWRGGLQLTGWLAPSHDTRRLRVRVHVDGVLVVEAPADRWRQNGHGASPSPAFNLHLPDRFATGLSKQVVVTDGLGAPLSGSPVTLVAFPDPLEALAEHVYGREVGVTAARARLFDALLPRSLPFTSVKPWLREYPCSAQVPLAFRLAVAIVGDESADVAQTRESLGETADTCWTIVALPSPDRIGFSPADLLAFLDGEAADCVGVLVMPAGTRLEPAALERFAEALTSDPDLRLVYGDLAIGSPGQEAALAFPAFDYERWIEQGYGALLAALPLRYAALAALAGADNLYRLANAQFDDFGRTRAEVVHLPGIVGTLPNIDLSAATGWLEGSTRQHLHMRGMPARVSAMSGSVLPAVRVTRAPTAATVSVIIPTRDRANLLRSCLASIRPALDDAGAELILVDNGSSDPETETLLESERAKGARVLAEPGPFNYARLMNRAVAAARGELVCLLHNDIEARDNGWLGELLSRMSEPSTAAVGAVLRWPSGVIQHGGIILGPRFAASHALTDRLADEGGYADLLRVASEPSAVTSACLLVRRTAYQAVGGMDEYHFPAFFSDIDLCLKLGSHRDRLVLTPHLHLVHRSSRIDGRDRRPDQQARFDREQVAFRARWGETLLADPAYNPILALSEIPFTALACPPRATAPRRRFIGSPAALPAGL